ncbi:hypothetical protein KR100_13805 [Synechococcus sp. KORDI-100]|nr:hypothetical protein KR100_13805 [Synechococcus sp. KORDI-100]
MGTDQTVQISEACISLVTATSRTSADCRNPGSPNLLLEPINPNRQPQHAPQNNREVFD